MEEKLGSVFVEFGLKGAEKLKDFAKDIGSLPLNVVSTALAFGGLSLTFGGFMEDMLNMTTGLREFHAQTGLTTDALEEWEQVGRRVGLTNDKVQGSFSNLVTGISKLKIGMGDEKMIMGFSQMGIRDFWTATPERLIAEMRQKFNSAKTPADRQKFMQWMAMTGVSPDMSLAFQSPLSEASRMAKMRPLYGKSGQDEAAEFTRVVSEVTDVFRKDFLGFFKQIEPDLPIIAKGIEETAKIITMALDHFFQGIDVGSKIWKYGPGKMLKGLIEEYAGNVVTAHDLGPQNHPGRGVTVNQHYYGDVDKFDIDAGVLDLKSTLTHTMRMLGKGGQ